MACDIRRDVATAIFFLIVTCLPLHGQEQAVASWQSFATLVEQAYGQDQELVNGMQYYNRHSRSLGSPFLMEGGVHPGTVTLRGKLYKDIWLRYDIYAQQVEVEYRTVNGANNKVVLINDRVDEFSIGERRFRKLNLEKKEEFFQHVGKGRLICYIRWEKKLVPVSGDSRFIEEYSGAKRSYLLYLDGTLGSFHNKKSFVKLFPDAVQKQLKKLIRTRHFSIRTATSGELELFIHAASDLLNEGGQA